MDKDDVYSIVDSIYDQEIEDDKDLKSNQRFEKLKRVKQLGIYVDEAHHAFGKDLLKDMEDRKTKTSLRRTIDLLAKKLEENNTHVVACYNYTGTPYAQNRILHEVVYSFGLKEAINREYLKQVELYSYINPTSKEFLKIIIKDFWEKYSKNRYEGMIPKLAIFASKIDEIQNELKPHVEEILSEMDIPKSKILVNVGDDKLTSNDDLREFVNLDTEKSEKQFILLVNKGKEGWNCRSLFGVALYRKPKSKIFVLQATMRCMRAITDIQHMTSVYLSDENLVILENELLENFRVTVNDLKNQSEKQLYNIKLVPPPVIIKISRVKKLYELIEKDPPKNVDLQLEKMDLEQYKIIETQRDGLDINKKVKATKDLTHFKENRPFSQLTLVAEISKYLNKDCLTINKILSHSTDGINSILDLVNQANEVIYAHLIPRLFKELYNLKEYENKELDEIELTKDPGDEGFQVSAKPELVVDMKDNLNYKDKTFHLDKYCFDSNPEKDFFLRMLKEGKIEKIYFTGMLTNKHSNFYISYIDPTSNTLRSYFPDFIIKTKDGNWLIIEVKGEHQLDNAVVNAKADYATQMAENSQWKYILVPSKQVLSPSLF